MSSPASVSGGVGGGGRAAGHVGLGNGSRSRSAERESSQQYCLRWNNHRSNLLTVFEQLLQTEAFTDVTLAVNGTSIKCHKMVLAACSSYFQSLFLENSCPHPIVVFKDIQYAEIRAILEYMYRGEVNVAQEKLPSLLKVAEALRVKGLFEDDSVQSGVSDALGVGVGGSGVGLGSGGVLGACDGAGGGGSSSNSSTPSTSNAQCHVRSTSGHNNNRSGGGRHHHRLNHHQQAEQHSTHESSESPAPGAVGLVGGGGGGCPRTATSTPATLRSKSSESPAPTAHAGSASPVPRHQMPSPAPDSAGAAAYSARHPYLYKSALLGSQAGNGAGDAANPLNMWPPLVMPLHLGAFENALREREQALALYGITQQHARDKAAAEAAANNNNGRDHDAPSGGSGSSSVGSVSGSKRKRLLSNVNNDVDPAPLLRTVLGPHLKAHDIPGLFPFRLGADASSSADDRTHLAYLPMMAYAERQAARDRDDDWSHNPDLNSEEDASEMGGEYGHAATSSPLSDKRVDASGARIAAYVPTQKLEWKRYKQYTNNDITAAIEAVKNGMSALQASRKFKVPSRTLYDKVKKLGIATTRPYSRVSSSPSSAAAAAAAAAAAMAANQNQSMGLSNFAASTAALTSAMAAAASALSLVKRERGPVIQVATSSGGVKVEATASTTTSRQGDVDDDQADALSDDEAAMNHEESSSSPSAADVPSAGAGGGSMAPTSSSPSSSTIKTNGNKDSACSSSASSSPAKTDGGGAATSSSLVLELKREARSPTFPSFAQSARSYFAVRDDLNTNQVVGNNRTSASPNPSST